MFNNQRFKNIRRELNLTQKELSEALGIQQGSLSDIERGKTIDLSTSVKNTLKERYNINIDYLYNKTDIIFINKKEYDQPEIINEVNEINQNELKAHFGKLLKKVNKKIEEFEKEANDVDTFNELNELIHIKKNILKDLESF